MNKANKVIGHYVCPNPKCAGDFGVIRKNRTGRLYGWHHCGELRWWREAGQNFFLENGTIWGSEGPPAFLPAWIREGKCSTAEMGGIRVAGGGEKSAPVANKEAKKPALQEKVINPSNSETVKPRKGLLDF